MALFLAGNPDHFTLEFHHGGRLVNLNADGSEKRYVGGMITWGDYANIDYMSLLEMDGLAKLLGYNENIVYYYKEPGHPEDRGWVAAITDACILRLCGFQTPQRVAVVYFCHPGNLNTGAQQVVHEPKPIQLSDGSEPEVNADEGLCENEAFGEFDAEPSVNQQGEVHVGGYEDENAEVPEEEGGEGRNSASEDENDEDETDEDDFDYVDSDYEQSEDETNWDDDVDPEVHSDDDGGGFGEFDSEDMADSDNMGSVQSSSDDFEEDDVPRKRPRVKPPRLTVFRKDVDMKDPKFTLGQCFASMEVFKEAIKEYSILNDRELSFKKNHAKWCRVGCAPNCPWHIHAVKDNKSDNVIVRQFLDEHTCTGPRYNCHINAKWLAKRYGDDFRTNPKWDVGAFQEQILKQFNVEVTRTVCYTARRLAFKNIQGQIEEQFGMLWDYAEELQRTNENTTVKIQSNLLPGDQPQFQRMYICFGACKRAFIDGCRPVIGMDGCFLKGPHKGQLLAAIGVDANNGMVPLAYAVVEIENRDSWGWFMQHLIMDLNLENSHHYVILSDKQKGLIDAVKDLLPNAEHRHCVKHLGENFRKKFPSLLLKEIFQSAARSTYEAKWRSEMNKMKEIDGEAYKWFDDKPPHNWSKAFFKTEAKCDLILNNLCESFNAAILKARDQPILTLLERLRMYVMLLFARRREQAQKWKYQLGPRIRGIIDKRKKDCCMCRAFWCGGKKYQVITDEHQYAVDLDLKTCSCRQWDVSGIPCCHAISSIWKHGRDLTIEEFTYEKYHVTAYQATYAPMINPMPGKDQWIRTGKPPLKPPCYKKQAGRPKKVRARDSNEPKKPPNPTKLIRFDVTITCKKCGKEGHNSRTCGRENDVQKKVPN